MLHNASHNAHKAGLVGWPPRRCRPKVNDAEAMSTDPRTIASPIEA
jgi:hypothetical protein